MVNFGITHPSQGRGEERTILTGTPGVRNRFGYALSSLDVNQDGLVGLWHKAYVHVVLFDIIAPWTHGNIRNLVTGDMQYTRYRDIPTCI